MDNILIRIINKLIVRMKGPDYNINKQVPINYLLHFIYLKIIDRIRGYVRFYRKNSIYCGSSVKIRAKSLFVFGNNLVLGRYCYIDALGETGIKCGTNVSFGMNTTMIVSGTIRNIGKGIIIGDNVGLGTHGYYGGAGGLEIGNDTIIGNFVSIHPENHNYKNLDIPIRLQGVNHKGIKIGSNCWIGAKATILDGTILGNGCIVAAGAVVSGKFPDNVIIGGVPAKIIKYRS